MHPVHYLVHHTEEGELKLVDQCGFKSGSFNLATGQLHDRFVEDREEYISETSSCTALATWLSRLLSEDSMVVVFEGCV